MKSFLLLLAATAATFAQNPVPPPSADGVRRVQSLYSETLPELRLQEVSLQEAVDQLRDAWEAHHPKETFPVAITEYRHVQGLVDLSRGFVERISVVFVETPYVEALHQLAQLSGRQLITKGDIVRLEFVNRGFVDDYETREFTVTPETLAALGLKPTSDSAEIRHAFEHYDLQFDEYMKFAYLPARQKLVAFCFQPEQERIAGILFLVEKGFHITK